uniref:Aquaporin-1 n=1 Tax=Xenopus tropicalis TaxID=8364 RepID=A0A1B8YA67_XENTR
MASELKKKAFWRAVIAEFLAMILFVFISIGAALGVQYPIPADAANATNTDTRQQDIVKVSLAFGLAIATLAQSVGHISGAHLNPAVTLGCLLSCQISILKALMYIIAQCLGAVVGTAILSGITTQISNNSLGLNGLHKQNILPLIQLLSAPPAGQEQPPTCTVSAKRRLLSSTFRLFVGMLCGERSREIKWLWGSRK